MAKIILGPAGNVSSDILSSLRRLKQLGIEAQEVEFVRGVKMSSEKAKEVGELSRELGIRLSIHAPYYINLASDDLSKREASKKRILDSCERAHYMGARDVVFHAAYYGKKEHEEVYLIVKQAILQMQKALKDKGMDDVWLSPETTGKRTQFGDLDELFRLRKETGCGLCVDFAHLLARNNGHLDYREVFSRFEKEGLKSLHCHFSGIEFGEKGEKRHLLTEDKDIIKLFDEAMRHDIELKIINESPQPLEDTLKSKRILEEKS